MKLLRLVATLTAPLLLTGCLLSPGKFTSSLDVMRDGSFTFRYAGEIVMVDTTSPPAEFSPSPCYDDETYDERPCTTRELEDQRKEFEDSRAANDTSKDIAANSMGKFGSEESIAELVDQLKKQEGWKSVSYRGNRILDVDYEISGNLRHGFAFPLVDGGGAIFPFITLTRRKDGSVKVTAPAYSSGGAGGDMAGLGALAGAGVPGGANKAAQPKPEGSFTIVTDGNVLTNNTEDGPSSAGGKATLTWTVNVRSEKAPEALIGFAAQ
ncbi:hypothetical protein [Blastomonas sp.]|uniref:hypothetical protein n=1 Tax=Blastomonas sp. TaxID=1909299 RepID=UPI0035941D39